jgi:hypothetical protein
MANGDLQAAGKGALSGGGTGLAIGSNPALLAATGGLSAPIGAGVGALLGGGIALNKNKKANESQGIPMIDPMEAKRLAELEIARKNLNAGTDPLTQNMIQQNQRLNSSTQNSIARNTGGNSSATIDGLLRAQGNSQRGINEINAQTQQRIPYFDNAESSLLSRVADRKLRLQLLQRAQKTAENAQAQTDNNVSSNAILSTGILDNLGLSQGISGGSGGPEGGIGGAVPKASTQNSSMEEGALNPNSLLSLTEYFSKK